MRIRPGMLAALLLTLVAAVVSTVPSVSLLTGGVA